MFEQVEEARAGKGGKVLSEKEISKVLDDHRDSGVQKDLKQEPPACQ